MNLGGLQRVPEQRGKSIYCDVCFVGDMTRRRKSWILLRLRVCLMYGLFLPMTAYCDVHISLLSDLLCVFYREEYMTLYCECTVVCPVSISHMNCIFLIVCSVILLLQPVLTRSLPYWSTKIYYFRAFLLTKHILVATLMCEVSIVKSDPQKIVLYGSILPF